MALIVQKFGGTSVADAGKIRAAAERAVAAQRAGNQVVMVVSARGKKTDELVRMASELTATPPAREMDMLLSTGEQESVALMAMAIHALGESPSRITARRRDATWSEPVGEPTNTREVGRSERFAGAKKCGGLAVASRPRSQSEAAK